MPKSQIKKRNIKKPFLQFREEKEKYRDLSSGSRRERELREIFTKILCGEEKEKFQEEKEKFQEEKEKFCQLTKLTVLKV